MAWLLDLFNMPARAWRGYVGTLTEIRDLRAAGLCIVCERPADGGGDFCVEHHREQMTAP